MNYEYIAEMKRKRYEGYIKKLSLNGFSLYTKRYSEGCFSAYIARDRDNKEIMPIRNFVRNRRNYKPAKVSDFVPLVKDFFKNCGEAMNKWEGQMEGTPEYEAAESEFKAFQRIVYDYENEILNA